MFNSSLAALEERPIHSAAGQLGEEIAFTGDVDGEAEPLPSPSGRFERSVNSSRGASLAAVPAIMTPGHQGNQYLADSEQLQEATEEADESLPVGQPLLTVDMSSSLRVLTHCQLVMLCQF